MEISFPHYLRAKQSVDDRALNKDVLAALRSSLSPEPPRIIEVGGGIGTMAARLLRWDVIRVAQYVLVDELAENIAYARTWLPQWAADQGLKSEALSENELRIYDQGRDLHILLRQADMFDFIQEKPLPANLLIAHAVLDLLPMPESLSRLFKLSRELAWLTINFDGGTCFEPPIAPSLDAQIEALYHQSMDVRPTGGDSRAGRHLFEHLESVGAEILAAGASDWVVHPAGGGYPEEEVYFLECILHFFESSLSGHPDLEPGVLENWLVQRREQVRRGKLVYIAHQLDFLVRV